LTTWSYSLVKAVVYKRIDPAHDVSKWSSVNTSWNTTWNMPRLYVIPQTINWTKKEPKTIIHRHPSSTSTILGFPQLLTTWSNI